MISTARSTPKQDSSVLFTQSLPDPSHHLAALSPHDDTDSNSNSPILPPAIASLSFVRRPPVLGAQVEDVSAWAIDPASALRVLLPLLLAFPTHFLLPLLRPYLLATVNPFTPLFLLSHPAPGRLSAAVVRPELVPTTQLYLKGPGDLVLLAYSVVLSSFLRLVLGHTLFPMLAQKWGYGKRGRWRGLRSRGMRWR
ncbi:hypothetical protein B0H13DRAFT_2347890 [Mycena leptocephala]|nr:hypothetical protein B0H13DRAFT_2347890 [Mycena leptocephala]